MVLALFVDSGDPEFFDKTTRETISFACRGFVDLLESLHQGGMLRTVPELRMGHTVDSSEKLADLKRELKSLGVRFVDATDKEWKDGLTFKTLKSLDLQVGYQNSSVGSFQF